MLFSVDVRSTKAESAAASSKMRAASARLPLDRYIDPRSTRASTIVLRSESGRDIAATFLNNRSASDAADSASASLPS